MRVKSVNPRRMHKRVTLERFDETSLDVGGNPTLDPEPIGHRWGKIRTRLGTETFDGSQVHEQLPVEVELPSDSLTRKLTAKDRLKIEGKVYNIVSVIDMEFEQKIVLVRCVFQSGSV